MRMLHWKTEYIFIDSFRKMWKLTPTFDFGCPLIINLVMNDIPINDYNLLLCIQNDEAIQLILNKYII